MGKIGEKTMQVEKRTVPDDNDCLFSALSYLTSEDSSYSPAGNATLRKYCAEVVAAEPDTFQEWVLGMPNEQYQGWIQNKFNWGGENEILILATRKFKLEIAVVSMESFSVLAYGTDVPATGRIYIIYTGQHYEPFVGMAGGVETRVFPIGTDEAIEAGCI